MGVVRIQVCAAEGVETGAYPRAQAFGIQHLGRSIGGGGNRRTFRPVQVQVLPPVAVAQPLLLLPAELFLHPLQLAQVVRVAVAEARRAVGGRHGVRPHDVGTVAVRVGQQLGIALPPQVVQLLQPLLPLAQPPTQRGGTVGGGCVGQAGQASRGLGRSDRGNGTLREGHFAVAHDHRVALQHVGSYAQRTAGTERHVHGGAAGGGGIAEGAVGEGAGRAEGPGGRAGQQQVFVLPEIVGRGDKQLVGSGELQVAWRQIDGCGYGAAVGLPVPLPAVAAEVQGASVGAQLGLGDSTGAVHGGQGPGVVPAAAREGCPLVEAVGARLGVFPGVDQFLPGGIEGQLRRVGNIRGQGPGCQQLPTAPGALQQFDAVDGCGAQYGESLPIDATAQGAVVAEGIDRGSGVEGPPPATVGLAPAKPDVGPVVGTLVARVVGPRKEEDLAGGGDHRIPLAHSIRAQALLGRQRRDEQHEQQHQWGRQRTGGSHGRESV